MVLLDSNTVIYSLLPEHQKVRNFFIDKAMACSIVSKIEVLGYHQLSQDETAAFYHFFENINILPLTSEIAAIAIDLRSQRKMTLGDSIIAATALLYKIELITANIKDFSRIEGLNVTNPLI